MRDLILLSLLACLHITSASLRLPINPRENSRLWRRSEGFVEVPLTRTPSDVYVANLTIGSNSEKVSVVLDTGSSDLWVHSDRNLWCTRDGKAEECMAWGTFDYISSESFVVNVTAPDFSAVYADGTAASGFYGVDNVTIGDVVLERLSIALATEANATIGVLGIGLPAGESTSVKRNYAESYIYSNVPMAMVDEGITSSNAFSLYLGGEEGTVLFGAVDHSKYYGNLTKIAILNPQGNSSVPSKTLVTLSGIDFDSGDSVSNALSSKLPVLLKSGFAMSFLPEALIDRLIGELDAEYDKNLQLYRTECSKLSNAQYLFDFTGCLLPIPATAFWKPENSTDGSECLLSIFPTPPGEVSSLGTDFLQYVYAVIDQENYEVAFAPVQHYEEDGGDEEIEIISGNIEGIPSATKAVSYSATYSGVETSLSLITGNGVITDAWNSTRTSWTGQTSRTQSSGHTSDTTEDGARGPAFPGFLLTVFSGISKLCGL